MHDLIDSFVMWCSIALVLLVGVATAIFAVILPYLILGGVVGAAVYGAWWAIRLLIGVTA